MITMQQRILDRIEAMATKAKLEPAQQPVFANTGRVFLHRKGDITPFASVSYNFQDATYTLRIEWEGMAIPSQPGRSDYFDFYQKYEDPNRFWETFSTLLSGHLP